MVTGGAAGATVAGGVAATGAALVGVGAVVAVGTGVGVAAAPQATTVTSNIAGSTMGIILTVSNRRLSMNIPFYLLLD
jgi:hypothetical protein